ncbi:MAG: hypothetical protein CEE38_11795 [Planctomycetes bacterium B3_Pla]|nr:MAG: hypothetical protein CEE38_11795 [Planctomycetes bacterium B3_Pla]
MKFSDISKFAKKVPRKGTGLYYDPLYGYVPLPDYLREAMDLDVFQRLQGIQQLSTVYLTFRGAVHTRFDHCVGTAYLASILFNRLREFVDKSDTDAPKINSILEASISLAALFHDVGHGPFGHIFEMFCRRERKFKDWTHEKMAKKLITGQDETGNDIDKPSFVQIKTVLEKIRIRFSESEPDRENIALLKPMNIYNIASGNPPDLDSPALNNKYYFLKDIIASSYGLDRLDYLKRDAYFSGVNTGNIDIGEIISNLILKEYDNKYKLFLKIEGMPALETLLQARNLVYRRLYHNSVHRSAQELIIRGLGALQCEPEKICFLTDNEILTQFSETPGLPSDISNRVKFRVLYENIHLCPHLFIKDHKATLQKYREKEGEWLVLKGLEDEIAKNAGMDKDSVFYDIEIIPAVKRADFTEEIFFDEIEGIPKNLFDLAPHLDMIYGDDHYDQGYSKAERFNESVSDIIVCFPYDKIEGDIEKLRTKVDADLENGIDDLYKNKLEPLVKGFFSKILKVTESDSGFFEKHEDYFSKMKKKCVKYLTALTH